MTPARRRTARVVLALAGLFYLSNLVEVAAGFPLDPLRSVLSELAARDQPTSALVRTTDTLSGVLLLAGLLVVLGRRPRATVVAWSWAARVVVVAAALLAVSTIADAALPLDCAVSEPVCAAAERAGDVSDAHRWHTVSSVVAGFAAFVLCVATAVIWWRPVAGPGLSGARTGGPRRSPRLAALVASTLGVLATTWIVVDEALGWPTGAVTQRLQILAVSGVVALLGWTLLGRPKAAR